LKGVILLTGTPGTGKTTIARLLAQTLGCMYDSSSKIAHRLGVARPDPTGRKTSVIDEGGARRIVEHLRRAGGCVVLESVTPRLLLDEGLDEDTILVVLLRAHPRELCRRLDARRGEWPEGKILENCASEALNVIAEELLDIDHSVIEIDTTGLAPEEALEEVLDRIEAWDTGVRIDWLSRDPELVEDLTRWLSRIDFDQYGLRY